MNIRLSQREEDIILWSCLGILLGALILMNACVLVVLEAAWVLYVSR